jgi:hypothetical protein
MKRINYALLFFLLLQVSAICNLKAQTYYINENFSTGSGFTPPTGWTNNQISAPGTNWQWDFSNSGSQTISSPMSSPAAIFDSDHWGSHGSPYENVALESPAVNTTGSPTIFLKWDQFFDGIYTTSGVADSVAVEVYNGSSWNAVYVNKTAWPGPGAGSFNIDVSAYASNRTGVKVRFRFVGWWSYYWIVDNVQLYAPPACTGTPAPGNTVSSSTVSCSSSSSFTLSLQNATSGTGVTYQWQSSLNGTSWSNISSANSSTYTTTQSASTYYRCTVGCTPASTSTNSNSTQIASVGTYTLPFLESFDVPRLPSCWAVSEGSAGATYHWQDSTTSTTNGVSGPFAGNRFCHFLVYWASTSYNPYNLISPPIALPAGNCKLNYYYFLGANGYTGSSPYPLLVQISTNGGSSWTTLYSHTSANSTMATSSSTSFWTPNTLNLNSYAGQTIQLRFVGQSNYGSGVTDQGLDEVSIKLNPPTFTNSAQCGPGTPTCSVASTTGVTTPSFRWYLAPTGGTALAGQTGATLSSYSISSSTSFYVSESVGGIESDRIQVDAVVNSIPNASVTSATQILCYNGTGSATTTIQTGTGTSPFNYSWNSTPVQTSSTATNLPAGSYICTVTDNKGCTDTATITLNNASPSTVTTVTTQPSSVTTCTGTNTSFTAAGTGLGTISYQWWVNPGTGFVVLTDAGIYSGSATATLTLTNVTGAYNGYQYRCVITGTCGSVTTNTATLTVNSFTPSVFVSTSPGTSVCQSTVLTFTANPTNGGSAPAYQWSVDGSNIGGATNSTFVTSTLSPGFHTIRVAMTSNQACTFPLTVQSSGSYFVNITASVTPTVSITVSPSDTICAGASVTYTSAITNGGNTPTYQWKINGVNAATGTPYTTSSLANGDVVSVVLTSTANCRTSNTANSNNIPMTVRPIVTPLLSIATNTPTICSGDQIIFTSTPTYPGTAPSYQWKINGNNAGVNSATLTASGFNNNDVVSCVMTSNFACVVPPTATSNNINITVLPRPLPALTISATPDTSICTGTLVTFTTNTVNGGTAPSYQWQLNGVSMTGATTNTYSAGVLNSGDIVSCVLNSSVACATPQVVTSNALKFNVTPTTPPSIFITAKKGNIIKEGDTVTFNALVVNAGTAPTYIWKKNGAAMPGGSGVTFMTSDLQNNDQVTLTIISSSVCSNPDSATSNSVTILINTGVGNIPEQALRDIKLYPNPNTGRFTIEAKLSAQHAEKQASIEVLNNLGQLVYRGTLPVVGGEIKKEIQLENTASGTYFVRMNVGDENFIERFIVQ